MANNLRHISNRTQNQFLLSQLIHLRLLADLKKSFLGWLWLIIIPLINVAIWILVKNSGVLKPGVTGVSYTSFVLLSTILWFSFYDVFKNCSQLFANYGKILLVNRLPIKTVIISELVIGVIKFLIPFVMIVVFFLVTGSALHFMAIPAMLIYLCLVLLGASIGLVTSLFTTISKDFMFLIDNGMRLLMFLTPVVYATTSTSGLMANILKYNPLTYLFDGIRSLLFFGELEQSTYVVLVCLFIFISFLLVSRFFIINTPRILERGEI